jgi:hypothetical protein
MLEKPVFLQGVFSAKGTGLTDPVSFTPRAVYRVSPDRRSQTIYFRVGNASSELVSLLLTRQGAVMRYFPVGAKDAIHVALAVQEDISPETTLEVLLAAPDGLDVSVVLDVGFMEISS